MSGTNACSVIIISYNSGSLLPNCLHSVFHALQGMEHQVIVLDNGSPEPLTPEIKNAYPQVEWMHSDTNLGFGKACNRAAENALHPYLFFVNPDTLIGPDTFRKVLDYAQNAPKAGVIGCKILNGDGTLQWACRRSFPTPMGAIYKTLGLALLFQKNKRFGAYNLTYLDPNEAHEVDAVSGSFFCVEKKVYQEVNGFDEDYFLYGEDLDICYRIQKAGYHNHYYPGTSIFHFKGQSSRTRLIKSYVNFYQAMVIFVRKHPKFLDPIPLWLMSVGVFFAAALGVFSRLLPDWIKLFVDVGVFTLAWTLGTILIGSPMHWSWFGGTAGCVFLPLLVTGAYGFGVIPIAMLTRRVVVLTLLGITLLYSFSDWPIILVTVVSAGFILNWFWRRLFYWFQYFKGVFTGKRRRSILLGYHSAINRLFLKENILAGRDILGCVSRSEQGRSSTHFLGKLSDLPNIRANTGAKELIIVPDEHGWHEIPPTKMDFGGEKFDTLLLIGHPDSSTFAMVDLHFLK